MLLDFFNGDVSDAICLTGIEHVISITLAPTPPNLTTDEDTDADTKNLPAVHIRTFTVKLFNSGTRVPRTELVPMGPSLDLVLRRHQPADSEILKQAMKQPKLKKKDVEKGLGKKRKNIETDEMGDVRGQIHLGKQDLGGLQVRKMRGLKEDGGRGPKAKKRKEEEAEEDEGEE